VAFRPFLFLPLFTGVPRSGILRSLYTGSCIVAPSETVIRLARNSWAGRLTTSYGTLDGCAAYCIGAVRCLEAERPRNTTFAQRSELEHDDLTSIRKCKRLEGLTFRAELSTSGAGGLNWRECRGVN
jgi:hypothetical protein